MTRTAVLAIAVIALLFLGAAVLDANRFIRRQSDGSGKKNEVPVVLVIIPALCIIASFFIR